MTYNSSFQDRAGQAAAARQKALDQLRSRPPVDEKLAAERIAAGQQRDAARAHKAATKKADRRSPDKRVHPEITTGMPVDAHL